MFYLINNGSKLELPIVEITGSNTIINNHTAHKLIQQKMNLCGRVSRIGVFMFKLNNSIHLIYLFSFIIKSNRFKLNHHNAQKVSPDNFYKNNKLCQFSEIIRKFLIIKYREKVTSK